jgi:hypothetical protein
MRPLKVHLRSGDTVFFLHLPKAGGTTFYAILEQYFPPESCFSIPDRQYKSELPSDLNRYRLVRAHQGYDVYRFFQRTPIYVTMLRNPVTRVVSYYKHMKRDLAHPMHDRVTRLSLLDCLSDPLMQDRLANAQTRRLAFGTEPGDDLPPDRVQLEMAKVRLHEFAYFGLVEFYVRSVQLLTYSFSWPTITEFKTLNTAPPEAHENVSLAVQEAIAECNYLDVALYDYAVQLFQERYRQMFCELIARTPDANTRSITGQMPAHINQRHYHALLNRTAAGRLVQLVRRMRRRIIPENSVWEQRYYELQQGLVKRWFSK